MAKLKIRKLVKEQEQMISRLNDLTIMLAFIAHKNGGEISFTKEELKSIPDAAFGVTRTNDAITLKLRYDTSSPEVV